MEKTTHIYKLRSAQLPYLESNGDDQVPLLVAKGKVFHSETELKSHIRVLNTIGHNLYRQYEVNIVKTVVVVSTKELESVPYNEVRHRLFDGVSLFPLTY